MRRTAILIEAANVKGCKYIPGAEADVRNYQRYLKTSTGGAWFESEILTLTKPSSTTLLTTIERAQSVSDYLFISFSGHGYMKKPPYGSFIAPSEKELTILCLNDDEQVPLSIINPRIRNFVIADSCRGYEEEILEKAYKAESRALNFAEGIARQVFDHAVLSAEIGQAVAYSCGINESAGEDKNRGGYFSAAMMECGLAFATYGTQRAISVEEVFRCAFQKVKAQAATQNPEYTPGRRIAHFPFAVRN